MASVNSFQEASIVKQIINRPRFCEANWFFTGPETSSRPKSNAYTAWRFHGVLDLDHKPDALEDVLESFREILTQEQGRVRQPMFPATTRKGMGGMGFVLRQLVSFLIVKISISNI